jgi:hypothetical protein
MILSIFASLSLDTKDKKVLSVVSALVGLVVGCIVGLVVFALLSPATQGKLTTLLFNSTRAALTAILTTTFTYFFIQRYLRKREAESNVFVAQQIADVRYFFRSFEAIYDEKYLEEPADTAREAAKLLLEMREKLDDEDNGEKLYKGSLEELLFSLRGIPSVFQASQEKMRDLSETLSSIRESLPGCSPKFAATIPPLLKVADAVVYRASKALSVADRALKEALYISDLKMLNRIKDEEIRDILDRICDGVVMLYRSSREEFQHVDDQRFVELINAWSAKEKAAYDEINEVYQEDLSEA